MLQFSFLILDALVLLLDRVTDGFEDKYVGKLGNNCGMAPGLQ